MENAIAGTTILVVREKMIVLILGIPMTMAKHTITPYAAKCINTCIQNIQVRFYLQWKVKYFALDIWDIFISYQWQTKFGI